jgi:hypothetical protein
MARWMTGCSIGTMQPWRYDFAWAFLLAAGECNLAGGGNCVKEWACKKAQHHTTIDKKTSNNDKKEWACRKINDSIQQSTSIPRVCLVSERNQGGKKLFEMVADGKAKQNGMAISRQCWGQTPFPGLGESLHGNLGGSEEGRGGTNDSSLLRRGEARG